MSPKTHKILIIIPAFQEEATIGAVIDSVREGFPEGDILVVDDGSSDDTGKIAALRGARVLTLSFNLGIGGAVQTGYKYACDNGYEIAVQVDADGQHPAAQIRDIVAPVASGDADVVVGSRFLGVGDYKPSIPRGAGIAIFSKVVSFIIKEKLTDTTSGFRAVGRRVIEYYCTNYPEDYPEVEVLVMLHKKGYKIIEVPVTMTGRKGGASSITPIWSVYYMIKVLFAIFVDLLRRPDK